MAKQTVELAPGESKEISFEAIPKEVKTYSVSVNGLVGSFVVIAPIYFYCPHCGAGPFTLRKELYQHIDTEHPGAKVVPEVANLAVSPILFYSRYDSGLVAPTWGHYCRAEVTLTNISDTNISISLTFWKRFRAYRTHVWSAWRQSIKPDFTGDPYAYKTQPVVDRQWIMSGSLAPGETKIFSAVFYRGHTRPMPDMQVKFVGAFGLVSSGIFDMWPMG